MLKVFEGAKIDKIGKDTLDMVRRLGKNVSYTETDRHIEAYEYRGHIYIASVQPAGPRE